MFSGNWFKDFFYFNKKDRIFAFVVVITIGGSLVLPRLVNSKPAPLVLRSDDTLALAIDTLQQRDARKPAFRRNDNYSSYQYERSASTGFTAGALFAFDPNTATSEDWQRMGLNARTSKTIVNYTSKGGKFYKPEDLQKIWGLPDGFYERVQPYITITSVQRKAYPTVEYNKPALERKERLLTVVNMNEADTAALIALPGIGSKLSARILAFREKLGGFHSVEQVGETYGLPDSTFQQIKARLQVDGARIRKLNVNTATKDELKVHPYIRWNLANAIVEYRTQHGTFKSLEELKHIVLIDEATYQRIVPYLGL